MMPVYTVRRPYQARGHGDLRCASIQKERMSIWYFFITIVLYFFNEDVQKYITEYIDITTYGIIRTKLYEKILHNYDHIFM